ncbi:cold-shock protein [Nocardia takedensis]|uniref:cold-shock protein n=1 Tax=Nocardia takedensis TaxID=259390 RepID=UPI0002DDBF2D|nr:cold shock domain-containing protein [Nocardia takedensis]
MRWFDADKGYGFIRRDRTGDDVFVHHAEIVSDGYRALSAAQRVRFHVHSGSKGLRSTRVEPL